MKLKNIVEKLSNFGTLVFLLYFITSLILYKTLNGFKNDDMLRYLLYIATLLIIPKYIYQFAHFNEYRKENIGNLIFFGIIILTIIYVVLVR